MKLHVVCSLQILRDIVIERWHGHVIAITNSAQWSEFLVCWSVVETSLTHWLWQVVVLCLDSIVRVLSVLLLQLVKLAPIL